MSMQTIPSHRAPHSPRMAPGIGVTDSPAYPRSKTARARTWPEGAKDSRTLLDYCPKTFADSGGPSSTLIGHYCQG